MGRDSSMTVLDGSAISPSITFANAPTTGFYRDPVSGAIGMTVSGVAVGSFGANGASGAAPVLLAAGSQTLTAAQAGAVIIAAVDAAFVLPLASTMPGGRFTVITGTASAGTGVVITANAADKINAKTFPGNATGVSVAITAAQAITNTGASDVVWDRITLVSNGVTNWYAISQVGIWA